MIWKSSQNLLCHQICIRHLTFLFCALPFLFGTEESGVHVSKCIADEAIFTGLTQDEKGEYSSGKIGFFFPDFFFCYLL